MANKRKSWHKRMSNRWLWMMLAFLAVGIMGQVGQPERPRRDGTPSPFTDPTYSSVEKVALILNVVVALAGLGYAWLLAEVYGADTGTRACRKSPRPSAKAPTLT